jgi:hypothetical protein
LSRSCRSRSLRGTGRILGLRSGRGEVGSDSYAVGEERLDGCLIGLVVVRSIVVGLWGRVVLDELVVVAEAPHRFGVVVAVVVQGRREHCIAAVAANSLV